MASDPQRDELDDGAWIDYWPDFWPDHEALLARLLVELPLASESYRMGARVVTAPRLVAWHGDPGAVYRYSGVVHRPHAWTPALTEVRERLEVVTGLHFHAVLANLYRDGADSMGYHADAEPEMGPTADDRWIASVSLGATRRFLLRARRGGDRRAYDLPGGSLLVMRGTTQSHWRHALPRTRRPVAPRLNLTFRHLVPARAFSDRARHRSP